jgi:O-antigen/teichoic acid export membrane protein
MIKVLLTIGAIQLLQMVVLLARTKGLALLLGPELLGVLAVIDKLIAVFAQTASLSLPFAALRFLPSLWASNPKEFYRLLRGMSTLLLGLSCLAVAVGLVITVVEPGAWGTQLAPYWPILLAAFLTVPVQAFVPFVQNATAAAFAPNRSMLFALAHAAVLSLTGVIGAWGFGLQGIYALYVVPAALLVGFAVARLNTAVDPEVQQPVPILKAVGLPPQIWRFGLALLALTFLAPYAALFVHYRVLRDLGPEAAGWMQAAIGISLAVRTILGSAHPVFLTPNVNRGGTPEERMQWASDFQKTLCLLTGAVLPPLLLFPDIAVRLLYSSAFLPGARFVFLFVLVEIVTLLAGTYQSLVLALDRLGYHVAQNMVAQGLMILVGAVAIRRFGISGAALAALSAQLFLYISTTLFLRISFGLRLSMRSGLLALYLVAVLLLAGIVGRNDTGVHWHSLLLLRSGVYVALLGGLALFLTRADQIRLRELFRELSNRALAVAGRDA